MATKKKSKKHRRKKLYGAAAAAHAKKLGRRKKGRRKAKKARAHKRKSHRKGRSGIRKRPVIIIGKSGRYYRPRRSKFFKKSRRVNGRRRRRNGGSSLMSVVKNVFQVRTISQYAALGGGIFAGTLFSRFLNTGVIPFTSVKAPASVTTALAKARPVHGVLHILLGALIAAKSRNKYVKDAGMGLAALGGFDLVMQVASRLGVPGLPAFSGMNVDLMGRYQAPRRVSGMNVDLRGMNVRRANLMGNVNSQETTEPEIADAINDMLS